mmetsp:Transcript_2268/g.4318  ORF Transcript_2268/g.4318 Transcript_2268/m.4318 type:complete len:252 (+) Transcript_2268:2108-2863(+)
MGGGEAIPDRREKIRAQLLEAQRELDEDRALSLYAELRRLGRAKPPRLVSAARRAVEGDDDDSGRGKRRRMVFIGLAGLESAWSEERLSEGEAEDALVILSRAYRSAVHGLPDNGAKLWRGNRKTPGPGPVMKLSDELCELLLEKERNRKLFWVDGDKPGGTFKDMSLWISALSDPWSGNRYAPLQLSRTWWKRKFPSEHAIPRFTRSGTKVATNLKSSSTELGSLQELLHQSNPTCFRFPSSRPISRKGR